MRTIVRNFISVIRRYRLATTLNVLGLSIAFAAFIVIMMQVDYDRTFNRSHENSDKIFRMEVSTGEGTWCIVSRPLSEAFTASSPHILAGTLTSQPTTLFFYVKENGSENYYKEDYMQVTPSYTDVFTFEMVEGSDRALHTPENVLIPQSIARKLFGNDPATGKTLTLRTGQVTVGGVYKDFPGNSSVRNCIYHPIDENENRSNWGNWNYVMYVRLDEAKNVDGLVDNFKNNSEAITDGNNIGEGVTFRLTPMHDLHFIANVSYDEVPKSSRQSLFILVCIAFAIIIIAGINFNNFSAALVPKRIRSINTQKVLGGDTDVIRAALVLEAVFICLVSFCISLVWIDVFRSTQMAALIDADLSPFQHPGLLVTTVVIAIATGILSGIYPAWYVTSFSPALVLKGSFGLSPKGRQLRNVLICVQFIASFALIIGASFMFLQNYYMQHAPLGYERDGIIVTDMTKKINQSREAFKNKLVSHAEVQGVTFAEALLSGSDNFMGWGRRYRDKEINYKCLPVDPSFLDVMGIKVSEGRSFREEDWNSYSKHIFNETARAQYELELNTSIDSMEIVGFIPDIKFASFRFEVTPMAFLVWGNNSWGQEMKKEDWNATDCYIKIKAGSDLRTAMNHVRSTLAEFDDTYPFDVRFFDDVLNRLYDSEQKLGNMITLFSLIAILISIVGVFGLVIFDSEYRSREIGIRKVFGSTTNEILVMFNKIYIRILLLCFVIAAPLAWYAVHRWMENFAYRTPMYWWVYLFAFAIIFILTVSVVTLQNWRAASRNPVESIKE